MNHEQEGQVHSEAQSPRETVTVVNSYGLEMRLFTNKESTVLETDDGNVTIPDGVQVAKLSFIPFPKEYSDTHPTQTIASGIMGMKHIIRFFEYADEQNLPIQRPEYMVGYTGKDLARFAHRFGFHTKAVEGDNVYRVVGKFDEVKEEVVSFITSNGGVRAKAVFDRAHRENPQYWEVATSSLLPQVTVADISLPTDQEMDDLLQMLQREARREESFLKKVRIGTYAMLGGNLGLSLENIVNGNYVAGGIGAGVSLASAAVVASMEHRRQKRNRERRERNNPQ